MDTTWIEEYKKTEKKYKTFYKAQVKTITIYFYYINTENELYKIKKEKCKIEQNTITRDVLLYKIKKNAIDNNIKYKFHSILKYNNTSNDAANNSVETSIINNIVKINNITFEDTIELLQDLNAINIVFKEKEKIKKRWVKTLKRNKRNKHNRTHHK